MKKYNRFISGFLSLIMSGSAIISYQPVFVYASNDNKSNTILLSEHATGELDLKINFDLPQTKAEVYSRNINIRVSSSDGRFSTINLSDKNISGDLFLDDQVFINYSVVGDMSEDESTIQLGLFDISISDLQVGEYEIQITGNGYTTLKQSITIDDYSKAVIVNNSDGGFALGDFNSDGVVNIEDQSAIHTVLGSENPEDIEKFDLSGDGKIDITDLSYVNKNINVVGVPVIKDTTYIAKVSINTDDIQVEDDQNITDIFDSTNKTVVNIKPFDESSNEIAIPVTLSDSDEGIELSEVKITSPATDGAIKEGIAIVELADGTIQEIPFSQATTDARMTRASVDNVITINLGQKVAVKKVTIKVTKVEGDVGYASVSQVEFLKEVNVNTEDTSKVKNLSVSAGNEEVKLAWSAVNNVTGYTVYYGTNQNNMNSKLSISTNNATISGLQNNQTYYFKVIATNGDWTGTESAVISAKPIPNTVPGKPSNILITPADSSLRIGWSSTKDAIKYQVYYREKGEKEFSKFGGEISSTNTVITGLRNDVTYEIAVKAGNQIGFGDYSDIAIGTPEKEGFKMPELPTDDRINSSGISIKMADSSNVNWGLCPNFDVKHLIDNDANTYWIAKNYWYNSNITYTFDTPQDMNYALLVPYLDNNYKNRIDTYDIIARDENGNIISEVHNRQATLTSKGYIILTFPQAKNIKSLTIALGEKVGGPRVSVSEMAFYESSTLADDIANLFADNSFTTLNPDVELADIETLEQTLNATSSYYMDIERLRDEIALAKSLLTETPDLGVVKNDFVSRSAGNDNAKFGQSASALQPIGVTAKANSNIAIYAEIPEGENVYVVPTQYYGESGVWKGSVIKLESGRNYITIPKIGSLSDTRGGALYLTYSGDNADQIKIHVRGDSESTFETPILDLSNWYDTSVEDRKSIISTYITELQNYVNNMGINSADLPVSIRNSTEIATPSILLSMPADQILKGLQTASTNDVTGVQAVYNNVFSTLNATNNISVMTEIMYNNILAWEEEIFVANMVQGIIPSDTNFEDYQYPMETRQNIRYMRMFAGAFMYAAGEHIGVEYGSCAPLVQGKPTNMTSGQAENGLFGWGIAHEIGHNMDKIGYAEITNNIYSMAMQAWDGSDMTSHVTRLTTDGRWEKIFNKTAQAREGMANDVFVQLGMYWQLHLAYDNEENPIAFYNEFFVRLKSGKYSNYTKDERIALIASEIADRDLSEFFARWGMKLSQNALDIMNGYTDEERAIWYLNDNSRNARLDGISANNGTTSVNTSVNENIVTLNISNTEQDTVQGYEIIRNGVTIGFTTTNTYKDNLGAANNLAYTYEVVPVDILGNVGNTVKSDEIRISYDKTIDRSLYDMVRNEDGTITVTMKNGALVPVTGLKITDANGSNITVKIKGVYDISDDTEMTPVVPDKDLEDDTDNENRPEEKPDMDLGDNESVDNVYNVTHDTKINLVTTVIEDFGNEGLESVSLERSIYAKDDAYVKQLEDWVVAKDNFSVLGDACNIYFNKPNTDVSDTRIWTYDIAVMEISGVPKNATVELLDYPGDKVDFYEGSTVGVLKDDYRYGDNVNEIISAGTMVIVGTYRGDPAYNYVEVMATYNTTSEAQETNEITTITRPMNGYSLMFAEIPEDGAVSDISDGFFIFVPDLEAEKALNELDGVTDNLPLEIKLNMYRTDNADSTENKRLTSETLWLGFPDEGSMPYIEFKSE